MGGRTVAVRLSSYASDALRSMRDGYRAYDPYTRNRRIVRDRLISMAIEFLGSQFSNGLKAEPRQDGTTRWAPFTKAEAAVYAESRAKAKREEARNAAIQRPRMQSLRSGPKPDLRLV